jgi:TIR domain
MELARVPGPKTFVSYSWSSPEHQQWVIDLATQLRDSGIDATLDKWDLKEGHDSIAFMEKMVTDPTVEKVVIVSDRIYAEKADGRRGGVGTETQIISPQIYAQADQNKFVAVLPEVDAEGKPFLPTYYGSRIFIDLSREEIYPENFEQLVRWIFNRPAFPKPQLGQPPAYLAEDTVLLPTRSRASRAVDLLQKGSNQSESALRDYFETLAESFESLRLDGQATPFDQSVIDSIDAFLPYRDEFVRVIITLARQQPTEHLVATVKRFFEAVLPYCFAPSTMTSWSTNLFDNYKFIVHELFVYTTAVFLKYERFLALDQLLSGGFYVGGIRDFSHQSVQGLGILSHSTLESFNTRKQRLSLNRFSLQADLLKDRSKIAGVAFEDLMQADFVIFMRDAADSLKSGRHNTWYPDTLVFLGHRSTPFEVFARRGRNAISRKYRD